MKTGLALSGGGALGSFQLGAITYLYENGVKPSHISGTSVGAINALLHPPRLRSTTAVRNECNQRINKMNTILQARSAFFGVGILVGIFGLWGALSMGDGPQIDVYARTLPSAVLPVEAATTTSSPSYSGTSTPVWKGDTDSSLNNYQVERDACCPGEFAALESLPALAAALAAALATSSDMEILRQKIKADKKLVVAANMKLTEAEAKGFWPVYEVYQKDLAGINDRLAKLILNYADAYKKEPVSVEAAKKLLTESLTIEDAEVKLKQGYVPKLEKAIPSMKVARYLQIENKIRAIIKYELAGGIPLVQ